MFLKWTIELPNVNRYRCDLYAGWYLTAVRADLKQIREQLPSPRHDQVNVALYDCTGENGAEGVAYCNFSSLELADLMIHNLLVNGEGANEIAKMFHRYDREGGI
jgi:hypothetical protein